ncbi:hypothetical protein [Streptomyces sp. NPDC007172]|uniref:hypothetical protein n=1 Tax=Streptomyces sp. NPDC007172 TaxID=3364776 RepID=UPI0036C5199F
MSDAMPGPAAEPEVEARTEPEAEARTEPEAEARTEPEAEARTESEAEARTESEAGGPVPLGVARTPSGDPDIDALVERLGDVDHLGTDGHLEVYEDVHRGLRDALTALDAGHGGTSGPVRPLAGQRP